MDSITNTPTLSSIRTTRDQAKIAWFEQGFSIVCFLFFANGISTLVGDSEAIMKALRYAIPFVSLVLMGARLQTTLRTASKGWWLWGLVLMTFASVAWSITPNVSVESLRGEFFPMTAFATYFASRFNIRQQMRVIAITLAIAAFFSMFYALAVPSVGLHVGDKFDGAWKGIYSQKNVLSSVMALTMLVFFILSIANRNRTERLLARCGLLFSIMLIILSTSLSGLLVFIALLIIVLASRVFRWRGYESVLLLDVVGMIVLGTVTYLSGTWQDIVVSMGKDPTLSARTLIWEGSMDTLMARSPLVGFGRSAFWVPGNDAAFEIGALSHRGFVPSHGHNGYVDVLMDLGLVGFGLFVLGLLITFGMALRRAYRATEPEDLWPFAFLTLMMIYNMTESLLMWRTSLYWVVYMIVFLSIRRWPRRSRAAQAGPGSLEPDLGPGGQVAAGAPAWSGGRLMVDESRGGQSRGGQSRGGKNRGPNSPLFLAR